MAPYSMDLRSRVLRDSDAGMPSKEVAVKYAVSRAWVDRIKQRRRERRDRPAEADDVSPQGAGGPCRSDRTADHGAAGCHARRNSRRATRARRPEHALARDRSVGIPR